MTDYSSPYPGVNAHLNSFLLQPDGGWEVFHAEHIIAIRQALDAVLPANYYAAPEKSLQVTVLDDLPRRTTPDVSVFQTRGVAAVVPENATAPTAIMPIDATVIGDEPEPNAVNIYRFEPGRLPGVLVTRVELLSPANKPGGSHYHAYLHRRRETLHSHVNLVEIDYRHHTHPIVGSIPSYPRREPNATPYCALVSDPRPSVAEGQMPHYAIAVVQALPRLAVPLADADVVVLDLGAAYVNTVANARVLSLLADHTRPLVNPDRYTAEDQRRIRELIANFG